MEADDAKTRILNAAGPIFSEKGYEAATVREICEKAGANVAAINYYFGGKEQLYFKTFQGAFPLVALEKTVPHWPPGTEPMRKLRDLIGAMLARASGLKKGSWQGRLLMREMLDPSPRCREILGDFFRADFGLLLSILGELLPADTPHHRRCQLGFSIVGQCVHYGVHNQLIRILIDERERQEHYQTEQLAEHVFQVTVAALGLVDPLLTQWRSKGPSEDAIQPG